MFKAWFMKPPTLTVVHSGMPWRLFVQREEGGPWARGDIPSYAKAFGGVKLRLSDAHDMAIHCKPQRFKPPIVKVAGKRKYNPCPDGHTWCEYCRRPTVFRYFKKHPNIKMPINSEEKRCTICGSRLQGMGEYLTTLTYPSVISKKSTEVRDSPSL